MQDRSVFFVDFKHIQENTPSVLIDNFEFAIACWNGLDWFGLYLIFTILQHLQTFIGAANVA